jgi:hypothetical protein
MRTAVVLQEELVLALVVLGACRESLVSVVLLSNRTRRATTALGFYSSLCKTCSTWFLVLGSNLLDALAHSVLDSVL